MQDSSENRHGSGDFPPDNGRGGPEGWNVPKPEVIPSPTYWPFVLSLGAALTGLGVLTSKLIGIAGIILFILAVVKWVGELYHEEQQ